MKNQRKTRSLTREPSILSFPTGTSDCKFRDTNPPSEENAFEICHVSHFPLDVDVVGNQGHHLGSPWVVVLTDDLSRRELARHLTFATPSYHSCVILLQLCLGRWGCLPQILVVDQGKEFAVPHFDAFLARLGITKWVRSVASPRFAAVAERCFSAPEATVPEKRSGIAGMTGDGKKRETKIPLDELHRILREYFFDDIHLNASQTALNDDFR